jgi:hypothetical protein
VSREGGARTNRFLVSVTVVLTALGSALGVVGVREHSDASRLRARATDLVEERHALARRTEDAERRHRELRSAALRVDSSLKAVLAVFGTEVESSNRVTDVANRAADQFNTRDVNDVAATFGAELDAALGDLAQQTTAVHTALASTRGAVTDLRASSHG